MARANPNQPRNYRCSPMTTYRCAKSRDDLMTIAPRAVVHLRAQHARKRLGLIFGSGASKELGFPDWETLVSRIADHPRVAASSLLKRFGVPASTEGTEAIS